MLLADFLPGIVLAAPFGALADRMSRRRLAVGADILRAGAFIALAVLPSFPATVGFALLAGVGSALFRPAVNAAVSGLVTDEQRSPAMALVGAGISIGVTVGPALTALVLLFSSATVVLAANGVTFLLVAVYGVAMLVGSLALTRAGSSLSGLRGRLLVGLGLQGAGMVGSAAAPSLTWAVASFAVTGAGNALIVGAGIRLVQELVHERLLGPRLRAARHVDQHRVRPRVPERGGRCWPRSASGRYSPSAAPPWSCSRSSDFSPSVPTGPASRSSPSQNRRAHLDVCHSRKGEADADAFVAPLVEGAGKPGLSRKKARLAHSGAGRAFLFGPGEQAVRSR